MQPVVGHMFPTTKSGLPSPFTSAPTQVAGWIRGHWGIEAIHHIRDVTCAQDASQIRTGNGPQVKPTGHASIAAACRYHARDTTRTLTILGLSPG